MSQCVSRNFPGIFGLFRIFSVALLIYLDIFGFIFAQENISKKTFLSTWAEPRGPTRSASARAGPASGPAAAHPGPSAPDGCRRIASWACVPSVGVLDRQTYQGSTRGSRLCDGDRDRETENSKVCARTWDTRFIQVRVAKVANPTSCLEIKYGALRLVLVCSGQVPG
jgi:hypothetical protein